MKVRIPILRVLFMWLAIYLIIGVVIFFMFFNLFIKPWEIIQPVIVIIYSGVMIFILIISITSHYYEINKKDLTECKFGKKYVYFYSDIIYIDDEQAEKSNTLCFVTKYGHVKYLNFDKEGKIYQVMKAKTSNLLTREQVRSRFPGIKI